MYLRYGQTKPTYIYRLVTDNSLEKKIYDRQVSFANCHSSGNSTQTFALQVNKQGMADRIVDELNPDASGETLL